MTSDSGRHATRHDNEDWHGPKDARAARSASPNRPHLTQEERRQLRLNTTERYSKSLEFLSDDTTTDDELMPCPFCGNKPTFSEPTPRNWHTFSVSCDHCPKPLQPLGSRSQDRDAAIAAWNARTPANALQSRISEVERLTDAARNALLLIESSEFADTACIDEMAVAEQLRAALSQHRKV